MQTTQNTQGTVVDKYKKIKRLKKLYRLLSSSGILVIGACILSLVVLIAVLGGGDSKSKSGSGSLISGTASVNNLPPEVMRWKDMVEKECAAQGVPELVPYVLAIIMVESNGISEKLPDIMQSSGATRFSISTLVRNESVA